MNDKGFAMNTKRYILGIDQSTQGTKAVLFDDSGRLTARADQSHRQIISEEGWVSHDLNEIYQNVLKAVKDVIEAAGIPAGSIAAAGISNQRETSAIWDADGLPLADAVVWQCSRAKGILDELKAGEPLLGEIVREKTGLPLSPYFPAAKMAWLLRNSSKGDGQCRLGTMDSWLVYKLTGGRTFATDYSNASRTQLFHIHDLTWDERLCHIFGIPLQCLPQVRDSSGYYGETDFEGILPHPVPIRAVMGDSHAALFGQGCHLPGMAKTTYGTGASVMMNTGERCISSQRGLSASIAWRIDGKAAYALEGNINYAGAVISWLVRDLRLIKEPKDAEQHAWAASLADRTVLVPAFSGLGAPYWKPDARAVFYGMSRSTGQSELVCAALESIAFQVADVIKAMQQDCGMELAELRADGGPARNQYLMQIQSEAAGVKIAVASQEELSAIGAAYMAGIAEGLYDREKVFHNLNYQVYEPGKTLSEDRKKALLEKKHCWDQAVSILLKGESA